MYSFNSIVKHVKLGPFFCIRDNLFKISDGLVIEFIKPVLDETNTIQINFYVEGIFYSAMHFRLCENVKFNIKSIPTIEYAPFKEHKEELLLFINFLEKYFLSNSIKFILDF